MFKQLSTTDPVDRVNVILNGRLVEVPGGCSVAAAVLSQNPGYTRTTPVSGSKRAPFCMMGVCYECLMVINGQANQRACCVMVQNAMHIETQQGVGKPLEGRENG